jgi:outer membrane biosynthesis protein TonB
MGAPAATTPAPQSAAQAQQKKHAPPPQAPAEKILRIGIIHGGRIVDERLIPRKISVSVGEHPKAMLAIKNADLPMKKFDILLFSGGRYHLQFTDKMHGKVAMGDQVVTLAALGSRGTAAKKTGYYSLPLDEKNRGKIYVGDYTLLFQFVAPPPRPLRMRSADFRTWRWEDVDWPFLSVLLLSALLHTAALIYIESQPPPKKMKLEDFSDRYVKLIIPPEPPKPPETKPVDEGKGEDEKKAEDKPAEDAPADDKPAEEQPSDQPPPETAEQKAARLKAEASQKGLLAIIGTAGNSATTQAVSDLLADASSVSDDVAKAVASSSGVAVGRGDEAGLKGGGGGEGAAGIGDVGGVGGGTGGSVSGQKAELKGKVDTGAADIASSPEDQNAVKTTMKRYTGRVKACYERELKGNPDLKGKVSVSFDIDTAGAVSGVAVVENSTGSAELADCIQKEIGRIRFNPPPTADVSVAGYPFILSPG